MSASIVIIGSANTEQILVVDKTDSGSKHACSHIVESFGGSAINWGIRLARMKTTNMQKIDQIYVMCPIGGDEPGGLIRSKLQNLGINVVPKAALGEDFQTSHSVIVTGDDDRKVYTKKGSAVDEWAMHIAKTIEAEIPADTPLIAMIGNIAKTNSDDADAFLITEKVIRGLLAKNAACIYANFGRAQYSFCYHYWQSLWDKITFFQLNADEAREFISKTLDCSDCREALTAQKVALPKNLSLHNILKLFHAIHSNAVITLAGNGSVAVTRESEQVIFTWPRTPTKHIDATGSGDAFGAGVICALLSRKNLSPKTTKDFSDLFSMGSSWAASACEGYGGHEGTPDLTELKAALESDTLQEYPSILKNIGDAEPLLNMLDDQKYYYRPQ